MGEHRGFDKPILLAIGAGIAMTLLSLAQPLGIWRRLLVYGIFAAALAPSAACLIIQTFLKSFGEELMECNRRGMLGGLIGPLVAVG